jgi:hypothetical protein
MCRDGDVWIDEKNRIARNFGSHLRVMSLIPSESYSFPDHFTKTVTPSRKPKNEEPEVAPVETRRKRPSIVPCLGSRRSQCRRIEKNRKRRAATFL